MRATTPTPNFVTTAANSPIGRVVPAGGNMYSVTGTAMLDLTDYASLRARPAYVLGNFLPYGFVGFVVGRANFAVTTEVFGQQNSASPAFFPCDPALPTCVNFDFTNSSAGNGVTLYGGSAGLGLDWALTPNFFLRGEFEYILFSPIANIDVSIIKPGSAPA